MDLGRYLAKANISHADFAAALALYGVEVTTQAIRNWTATDDNFRKPSPTRVLAIEAATGGIVTRHDLRPDVYGPKPLPKRKAKKAA